MASTLLEAGCWNQEINNAHHEILIHIIQESRKPDTTSLVGFGKFDLTCQFVNTSMRRGILFRLEKIRCIRWGSRNSMWLTVT